MKEGERDRFPFPFGEKATKVPAEKFGANRGERSEARASERLEENRRELPEYGKEAGGQDDQDENAPETSGDFPKANPADFAFRGRPRPVTRINRRLLAVAASVGAMVLLVVLSFAFAPPKGVERAAEPSGVSISGRTRNEAINQLPKRYSEIEEGVPVEEASFSGGPGDTSPGQEGGPGFPAVEPGSHRADFLLEEEMAQKIRAEKLTEQALRSEIFFPLSGESSEDAPGKDRSALKNPPSSLPFEMGIDVARAGSGADSGLQERKEGFLEGSAGQLRGVARHDAERKEEFLEGSAGEEDTINPHPVRDPLSPWQLMAGAVLRASLITGISSDLPGFVIAQVTEDVRDSLTGSVILIPKGARLVGSYDSFVSFGQERIFLSWHRIVMPDGSSIVVENLPAADTEGHAGLVGEVDNHAWALARGIALSTLLGVGSELAVSNESATEKAIRESLQGSVNDSVSEIVRRKLNVQPTLTAHPGWPLAVIVHRDLLLRPWRGVGAER